jgi:glycosyltransferase involved in cell wall biosynthesis
MTQRGKINPFVWYLRGSPPIDDEIQNRGTWGLRGDQHFHAEIIASREIGRRLKQLSPHPKAILTAGWTRRSTWLAVWAGKRLGVPVILPTDNVVPEPGGLPRLAPIRLWHRLKNRLFFDGFFTTGSLGVDALESTGVSRYRIARGLYPVDVCWWQKAVASLVEKTKSIRNLAGTNGYVVLAVTKLSERENPLMILEAFARFREGNPHAYLVLVGDGPSRPAVEEKIRSLSLQANVRCAGYVPYQELAAYYGAADVFIHVPRHAPWEISVLEAMACGLPVVATANVGAAHDLVVAGKTGALAPPGDVEALAQALQSVADASRNKESMRMAALDQARSVDVDAAAGELECLIDRLHSLKHSKTCIDCVGAS